MNQQNIPSDEIRRAIEEHNHDGINSKKTASSSGYFKTGSSSRTAIQGTGLQAITGVGFTPKLVVITATLSGTDDGGHSIGQYDGTTHSCFVSYYYGAGSAWRTQNQTLYIIYVYSGSNNDDRARAEVSSLDSDGFTLDWAEIDFTCTFNYIAYG